MDIDDDLSFLIAARPVPQPLKQSSSVALSSNQSLLPDIDAVVPEQSLPDLSTRAAELRQRLLLMESALAQAQEGVSQSVEVVLRLRIADLEERADKLTGGEQAAFIKKHRAARQELLDKVSSMPCMRVKVEEQSAQVQTVRLELSQIEALIEAEKADAKEAAARMKRYASMYELPTQRIR